MSKWDWKRAKQHKGFEPAFEAKKQPAKGGWTHMKRQPTKQLSATEIALWTAANPDRLGKPRG
jgi:hypothetical protein